MTGPIAREPATDARASLGTTGVRDSARAIGTLLAAGLAFRLIIAYLLPGSGFKVDLGAFEYWANNLAQQGAAGFYDRGFFADYTPGYLYVLWGVGLIGDALKSVGITNVGAWTFVDFMKLPSILADLGVAYLIYRLVQDLGASKRRALVGAAIFLFNPISWVDSVVWGQVDSFGVVFLLLGLRELWHDHPERAAIWATVAAVIKPQLGILVPIVAAVVIRRYLFSSPDEQPSRWQRMTEERTFAGRLRAWGARERGPTRVVTTATAGLATAVLLSLPFGMTILDLLSQVAKTAGGYPYLSVNAYNPWALVTQNGNGLASNGLWIRDVNGPDPGDIGFMFGPVPAVIVGTVLLLAAIAAVVWLVARRPDRLTILGGLIVLAVAFFVLPTRVHERYLYPLFALGAVLAAVSGRWRVAYVAMSIVNFLNMYVVLTTLYPDNPGISDWLGIGPDIRSMTTITIIALVHLGGFIWISSQMRQRSEVRLLAEIERGRAEDPGPIREPDDGLPELIGAPGLRGPGGLDGRGGLDGTRGLRVGVSAASLALADGAADASEELSLQRDGGLERRRSWSDAPDADAAGIWAAFRRAVLARPVRADRTGGLLGEKGGRIDRLDIWMLAVVVVAALCLRTFRLAEPYSMHFDEVYHARTATEFLQFWRYGIPHDIYEYTHPHLAKYAMAAGLVAVGDNQVTSQASLGTSVRDAAIELRWDNPFLPGDHAGDRVYVATGSDVRAYDLESRALVATIAVPGASAVKVDETAHRLYIGTDTGELVSVDTSAGLDPLRARPGSPTAGPPTEPFGAADAGIVDIAVPASGSTILVATASGNVITFDSSGTELARTRVAGATQVIEAGSTQQVVAQPALLTDRTAAASLLAQLLGRTPEDITARLNSTGDTVLLGPPPTASARTSFDEAVTNGTLTGVNVQSLPLVVAVAPTGLTFIVPTSGAVTQQLPIAGATGAAYVTGLDAPRIYVAAGTKVAIARLANDQNPGQGAYVEANLISPGPVSRVTFDASTNFVHVLGRTPDNSASTIYAIEVHGNAIFADARLPFDPVAWVTDAQPLYPSQDRQDVLAFAPDGAVATVDVGNNPFAWRLPGVIFGAATAGLLYLLARILFRRRSIAVFVAILTLADGMAFVQSRIGMNDVYVGFFIIAAYTLFAALWTKQIRSRWAFWVAMPVIGVLLGLALSSKWVGLYAVAGIGILILARSALGRLLIVLAMIAGTTVLGYMALNVPSGATSGGNLIFMLAMIALTIAAVIISVLHPIAWSPEEVRFAVAGPAAIGILIVLVAIPLGKIDSGLLISGVKITGLTAGLGLVALSGAIAFGFWIAGRLGFGPLAPPIPPEVAGRLTPASPPPSDSWLRLGSGFGIPAAWMGACLLVLPIAVYVISYLPWVALGNRLTENWPPGNHGQTLLDLTKSMYDYHNNLRAPHAASSPWWAWPFDFKPVWFYQGSFAGNTAASIYDAGNLVIWWLAIPAMIFCAWQAYRRRSLALALIVLGFAWQWLPWSRIDRATFQYHYYTSVPFIILALAYLLAELWHGASKRTWLIAKVAAALAVVGPALLWVGKGPLCRYVRVEAVNPGSQACVGNPGDLVVTARVAALVLILGIAVIALVYQLLRLNSPAGRGGGGATPAGGDVSDGRGRRLPRGVAQIGLTAMLAGVAIAVADRVAGEGVIFEVNGFQSTYLAILLGIPLVLIGGFILTARDSRRFVAGTVFAIVAAFLLIYPNISALPLPSAVVNAYQGLLPTYLYPFQFPVNTDPAAPTLKLLALEPAILLIALTITCIVVGYAAWVWRIGPVDRPTPGDGGLPAGGEA